MISFLLFLWVEKKPHPVCLSVHLLIHPFIHFFTHSFIYLVGQHMGTPRACQVPAMGTRAPRARDQPPSIIHTLAETFRFFPSPLRL